MARTKRKLPAKQEDGGGLVAEKNQTTGDNQQQKSMEKKKAIDTVLDDDDYDSSDEEDLRNTIGNIPVNWYDDHDHIGYDLQGKPIPKSDEAKKKSELDQFLDTIDDPDFWRKVRDVQTGRSVPLTDDQLATLENLGESRYPTVGYNPYQPFLDIYSSQHEIHPISNTPRSKQSFLPSIHEKRMVSKMVHAIKMGWIKPRKPKTESDQPPAYDLWADEFDEKNKTKTELARIRMHFPAPKLPLPTHAESYNPPLEYLLDPDELEKWQAEEPDKRQLNFIPQKFDSLRKVPAYDRFINERYERCLDLYLAPRQEKQKLNVDPSELLPELPNPEDLRPFPTTLALHFRGHKAKVCSLSMEPDSGELLVSGSEDGSVRVWLVASGRCLRSFEMGAPVASVAFCPLKGRRLVLAAAGNNLTIMNIQAGDKLAVEATTSFLANLSLDTSSISKLNWLRNEAGDGNGKKNQQIRIEMPNEIKQVVWHSKGDYFASVSADENSGSQCIFIHQLTTAKSQNPFQKRKGAVQCVAFHPTKPLFFVATRQHIRIYDLAKCQLKKKLLTGSKWISCLAVHSAGDDLLVGGLDRRMSWIDTQLSNKPWKSFRHHTGSVRSIALHSRYPLLATGSDDGVAMVYHARVHTDGFRENELVPLKQLRGHTTKDSLNILSTVFHSTQPWLFTAGADGLIALYTY